MKFGNPVRQALIRPAGSPIMPGNFRVTQEFGPTTVKEEPKVIWPGGEGIPAGTYDHFHRGLDLGDARCGAAVVAAEAGIVTIAGKGGDGAIRVVIDHGQGFQTWYYHLADEIVAVGQVVTQGQGIGHVGSTGNSTACHLHFQVQKDGSPVDPWARLEQNTTTDPDAPVQEADVPNPSSYIPGQVATVGASVNVNVRAGASTQAKVIRQIPKATSESWAVTCWEKGEAVSGSDQWLVRWSGAWEYCHSSAVLSGPTAPATDCAPLVKAARDTGYAEAKAAAAVAVAGI